MAGNKQAVVQETTGEDSFFEDSFEDLLAAVERNNLKAATSWLTENSTWRISYDIRSDNLVDRAVAAGNFELLCLIIKRFVSEYDEQQQLAAQGLAASFRANHAFESLYRLYKLVLQFTIHHGCLDILQKLLTDSQGKVHDAIFFIKTNMSLPLLAAQSGHLGMVKWLVENLKPKVTEKDREGKTMLLLAAQSGHLAIVRWLLDHGKAKIGEKDREGRNALLLAAKHRQEDVVTALIADYGADPGDSMPIARLLLGVTNEEAIKEKATNLTMLYKQFTFRSSLSQKGKTGVQSSSPFALLTEQRLRTSKEKEALSPTLTDVLLSADPTLGISQLGK